MAYRHLEVESSSLSMTSITFPYVRSIYVESSEQFKANSKYWFHTPPFREENDQKLFQCCASLLDTSSVILTAAHCVEKTKNARLFVRCGEWDLQHENELYPHQELEV